MRKRSKTTKKGIKVKIPTLVEAYYEQTIEELKQEVSKKGDKGLFRHSKPKLDISVRFRDFLLTAEKDIENILWTTKAIVERKGLDKEVDSEISILFSITIGIFNDAITRFDASSLSEDLLNHLKRELILLNTKARNLRDLNELDSSELAQTNEKAKATIAAFRKNLWDFQDRMKPYLKKEPDENG